MDTIRLSVTVDNFPLYVSLLSAVMSCFGYLVIGLVQRSGGWARLARFARTCCYISFASVSYAGVYMMQQILSNSRYDIAYISSNSSPTDALIYRISSFWAGQEGSLLLWACMGAVIGFVLLRKLEFKAPVIISFWSSIQAVLLMILVVGDPFKRLADFQQGVVGRGLNPLLKNPWMAIHPPVIFLGYAALAVPAAFAIHALIKGDSRKWANQSLPWALFGWMSLSAGLILGMVWSYEVLGWGGYWSWDPVENASFVPWLTATALVHGLILQRYRGRMARANIILALATFLLVIYATFLTRSGVLADISVHSFVKSPIYPYLRGILIFYCIFCIGLLIIRWKSVSDAKNELKLHSKDFALIIGVIVLALFAVVVCLGTSFSTFSKAIALDTRFYNHMSVPLAVAIVTLIAFSLIVKWGGQVKSHPLRSGAYIAHFGVALFLLGIVFSSNGSQTNLSLDSGGQAKSAFGYHFVYLGREFGPVGHETVWIKAVNGKTQKDVSLLLDDGRCTPHISSNLFGDLYVSPVNIPDSFITPTASLGREGWAASPVNIPGTKSTLTLIGMQVESRMAKLRYRKSPDSAPVELMISENKPARLGSDLLTFRGFVGSGSGSTMDMTAGVKLGIEGSSHPDRITIKLSTKPFIWLLWFGSALILLGGVMAIICRRAENICKHTNKPESIEV